MKKIVYVVMFLLAFTAAAEAADPVKIGVVGPFSGELAPSVSDVRQALDMLAADINRAGGIAGREVILIVEDDGGTPEGAASAAQRLVKAGVTAVVGSLTSGCTGAMQPILNDARIVQITYAATAVSLSEQGMKYFFRTCPRDDEQGKAATRVMEKMKLSRIALVHDGTPYATGLAAEIMKRTLAKGMTVVFHDGLTPGQADYSEVLKRIRQAEPDIVFYSGYYPEAAQLLKNRHAIRWNVMFMGGDGSNNPRLVEIAGREAAEGYYILTPPLPSDMEAKPTRAFMTRFKKKYGHAPESINTLLAADAFTAVTSGIRTLNSTDPDRLAEYLHTKYRNLHGLTGFVFFNAQGDRMTDLQGVYRIDAQGRFALQRLLKFGQLIQ